MNTRFSDHEFSINTLITIFFAYFDISTELATGSFFRMHGDRNNFYLIAFIFSKYQQKVRKIKYNQPDFFIKGYDPFHYSTLSPRNNHIFHEQKRYKWSDTIYTRYQLYFSLFSCWAKPLELLSCNLVKKQNLKHDGIYSCTGIYFFKSAMSIFCESFTALSSFRGSPDKMHPDFRYSSNPLVLHHLSTELTDCNSSPSADHALP